MLLSALNSALAYLRISNLRILGPDVIVWRRDDVPQGVVAAVELVDGLWIENCRALKRLIQMVSKVDELDDLTNLGWGEAGALVTYGVMTGNRGAVLGAD